MNIVRLVLVAVPYLATTGSAAAQEAGSNSLRQAVQAADSSSLVRVQLRDRRFLSGAILGAGATSMDLAATDGTVVVPYAEIVRYWERGRAIREGAVVVGVVGATLGAAVGALLASTCETCGPNESVATGALSSGLVAGGLGAAVGGIIGAAFPRWRLRWVATAPERTEPPRVVVAPTSGTAPRTREIGELTLQLAGAHGGLEIDPSLSPPPGFGTDDGAMVGLIASLSFRAGRFGLGPEILHLQGSPDVTAWSGLIRYDLRRDARIAPYLLAGVGGYDWELEKLLTLPLGVGVSFGADRDWRAEARWHQLVHHGSLTRPTLLTISAGRRFAW